MKPERRYLPSLAKQAAPSGADTELIQQVLDAIHDLNGKVQFVYEQLAVVAAAVPIAIETMED